MCVSIPCRLSSVNLAEYMVGEATVDFGNQHTVDVPGKMEVECQVANVRYLTPFWTMNMPK